MKFVSFASSSRGNCSYISYKDTNILVDAGISKKRIVENLAKYGKTLSDIDAILITHEHEDHIAAIPNILKNNDIKIMSQRETLESIARYCKNKGVNVNFANFKIIRPINVFNEDICISIKDIKAYPIKGSHDVPSVFYKFLLGDIFVAIMTDIGKYNDYVVNSISDTKYLMLECNYDTQMLMDSEKYPAYLKNRILGDKGHLSNVCCAEVIMRLQNTEKVYLSHISDETNSEEYAINFVNKYISENYKDDKKLPDVDICKRLEETIIVNE